MPDYYAILQVHPGAESEVIDAAYRRLAAKYHPDVSREPFATERMAQLNVAYEVLADPARRATYDASRNERPRASGSGRQWRRREPPASLRPLHVTVQWLPGLLVLLVLVVAARTFRLGPRELAVVAGVGLLLWLLTTRRVKKG